MSELRNVFVGVVHRPTGIVAACNRCRAIIDRGDYAISVVVESYGYFIGYNPPKTCCGIEIEVPMLFATEHDAAEMTAETIAILERDGSTKKLRLLPIARPEPKDMH